jgi:hypothetical protein
MNETSKLGFPEAAAHFGVSITVLRRAIRAGAIPAPAKVNAVAVLSDEWIASVKAAVQESPAALSRRLPQRVPAFARYEGTSAWRKYASRVRDYAQFKAHAA